MIYLFHRNHTWRSSGNNLPHSALSMPLTTVTGSGDRQTHPAGESPLAWPPAPVVDLCEGIRAWRVIGSMSHEDNSASWDEVIPVHRRLEVVDGVRTWYGDHPGTYDEWLATGDVGPGGLAFGQVNTGIFINQWTQIDEWEGSRLRFWLELSRRVLFKATEQAWHAQFSFYGDSSRDGRYGRRVSSSVPDVVSDSPLTLNGWTVPRGQGPLPGNTLGNPISLTISAEPVEWY